MSRIDTVFKQAGRKALITYVTVGYPSVEATLKVVPFMADHGCDIVELGIPFSDPLADGATIQRASHNALKNGVTPQLCLEVARELSAKVDTPLVFMTYLNPVLSYGFEAFCTACAQSGVSGLIIPDLPPEEGLELEAISQRQGIDLIYLLAPTSTAERIAFLAQRSRGFIYLVSLTGVTGVRDSLPADLDAFVSRVRGITSQPLCVGFGISTPQQARQAARTADGVIIGSRIIQFMETDESFGPLGRFIKEVRSSLDGLAPGAKQ